MSVTAFAIQQASPKTWTPQRTKARIQSNPKAEQFPRSGEIFACPNALVQELAGVVGIALQEHRRAYAPLDIADLA